MTAGTSVDRAGARRGAGRSATPAEPGSAAARLAGLGAVLGAAMLWSFGGVLGKLSGVGGVVLSFWRMWLATAVMVLVVLVTRRRPTTTDLRRAAPLGVLFGLNICAFFITLQYLSVAIALIIGALTPVVALPIAAVAFGERLSAVKMVCAVVAVAGVIAAVLLAPAPPSTDGGGSLVGYAWAVVSLLVWVAYLLVSKRVRTRVETVPFMFVMSFVGAITVSLLVPFTDEPVSALDGRGWLWVSLLAVGPGLAGHGLLVWAQPRIDASVSSVLIQLEPVGAAIAAWVILDEQVSLGQAVAMVVVLAALGVLAWREAREAGLALDEAIS
jgi:drug/metabolite transporter (DMT)-like permease